MEKTRHALSSLRFEEIRKVHITPKKLAHRSIIILDAFDAWLKSLPVKAGGGGHA
jgi:hypothetical protein